MTTEKSNAAATVRLAWPSLTMGLSAKMVLFLVVGTVSMIGLFAYLGTAALSENTQRNLQERVVLAQMTASYMDSQLENLENVLTFTAAEEDWTDPALVDAALERAYHLRLSYFASRVFLVNAAGHVIAAKPPITSTVTFSDFTSISAVLKGASFAVSHLARPIDPLGSSVIAAAPIRDEAGNATLALVTTLNLSGPNIRAFTHPVGLGQSGYMDLIALDGRILASTRPGRVGGESDHGYILTGMIRDHRQAVSACHDCHTPQAEAEPSSEIIAFAPLERAQWGITIRQSEDEVFGPTRLLQNRIFGLMIIILAGALILGYLIARSVIVPVQNLTAATERIASGDLDSPIASHAQDEIGVLARSLDEMRSRLKKSTEEIQAWNRELDARVQERTSAYQAAAQDNARLYAELQVKEQIRGDLLARIISAQEDERMRIARELHDETSQSLTALMVGMDTVHIALVQDSEKAKAHLRNCKSIAESLLINIHRLIADLRPTLLDDLGLVPAIAWYGQQRFDPLGISFQMHEEGMKVRLPRSMETALFRIVQEALTNIVRHAHATAVEVKLSRQSGQVLVQVSDNGRGFDPQVMQPSESHGQGLGLRGMQERVTILGGDFQLQTSPGNGTSITIRIALPEERGNHGQDSSPRG